MNDVPGCTTEYLALEACGILVESQGKHRTLNMSLALDVYALAGVLVQLSTVRVKFTTA